MTGRHLVWHQDPPPQPPSPLESHSHFLKEEEEKKSSNSTLMTSSSIYLSGLSNSSRQVLQSVTKASPKTCQKSHKQKQHQQQNCGLMLSEGGNVTIFCLIQMTNMSLLNHCVHTIHTECWSLILIFAPDTHVFFCCQNVLAI